MSYRKIVYPSSRLTRAVPGINVVDSPPNTISMVGILSDLFATDGTIPATGGWYEDKYNKISLDSHSLQIDQHDTVSTEGTRTADKRETTETEPVV